MPVVGYLSPGSPDSRIYIDFLGPGEEEETARLRTLRVI
jgi:hypothetical protein